MVISVLISGCDDCSLFQDLDVLLLPFVISIIFNIFLLNLVVSNFSENIKVHGSH